MHPSKLYLFNKLLAKADLSIGTIEYVPLEVIWEEETTFIQNQVVASIAASKRRSTRFDSTESLRSKIKGLIDKQGTSKIVPFKWDSYSFGILLWQVEIFALLSI